MPKKINKINPQKKMGRPIIMTEEKIRQLKAICRLKPTLEDCSAFLDVCQDTIINYCKSLGITFSEFRDQNMVHTRFMIIRNIIKQCENGNTTMLIYASKNLCGWSDKIDASNSNEIIKTIQLKYSLNTKDVDNEEE